MAPDIIERWKAFSYKTPTSYSLLKERT